MSQTSSVALDWMRDMKESCPFIYAHASTPTITNLMIWSRDGMHVDHLNNICHPIHKVIHSGKVHRKSLEGHPTIDMSQMMWHVWITDYTTCTHGSIGPSPLSMRFEYSKSTPPIGRNRRKRAYLGFATNMNHAIASSSSWSNFFFATSSLRFCDS